jgi:PBSX family phage portal protein
MISEMPVTGVDETDERGKEIDDDGYDINWIKTYTSTDAGVEDTDPFAKDVEFAKSLTGVHPNKKRSIAAMAKRREAESLQKRYESKDGEGRSKRVETEVITGYNAFEVVLPPYNLDYLAKLYELNETHKAAVDAKVSNIVGLGYDFIPNARTKLKMDDLDGEKSKKYQKKLSRWKIELSEAIDDMNEEDTFKEILEKVWKDYETMGNGYLEVGRSETTGKIAYIGHLPAATVRVRRDRDGFVQIIGKEAVFFRNFGKDDPDPIGQDSNPNEVIHIKKYAPSSTFYGIPDIVAAKGAVAGQKFSENFNLDYFENKAVPRHVIVLKGATINPRLAKNILEFFETGLKGKNHRSLFIPLPGDTNEKKVSFEIKPVEAGVQDSSFNNYDKGNRAKILTAHRVPVNKVGLPEGVSLAVARDADKTFKEQVCGPEQDTMEKKVNKIIRDIQGDQVIFDFSLNELTLTDEATQSQIDERRIKTGQRTPNELRTRDGLPAKEGGDKLFDINAKSNQQAQANEARAQGNRERDSQRSAAATDSAGEGRNPKGEGRTNNTG